MTERQREQLVWLYNRLHETHADLHYLAEKAIEYGDQRLLVDGLLNTARASVWQAMEEIDGVLHPSPSAAQAHPLDGSAGAK